MKNIFITGANGCVGNVLVKHLLEYHYKIFALALNAGDISRIKEFNNIKIIYGDICDSERLGEIFNKYRFDIVIHLAALVHKPGSSENEYMNINYTATKNLFDFSMETGVKQFIFISSVAVHGERGSINPINEISYLRPETPYAKSKYQAELYLRSKMGNIQYTIIRPTTVYGKYDNGNINKLFQLAKKGIVPILGNGKNLKSFVFVDNLVDGIISSIENEKAFKETFIISDSKSYSMIEIIRTMASVIQKKIIIIRIPQWLVIPPIRIINKISLFLAKKKIFNISSISKLTSNHIFDIKKATMILEYKPKYILEEGLKLTYSPTEKGV